MATPAFKAVTGLQLLVVDDNRDVADSLALLLNCAGHHVRVAYDGTTTLKLVMEQIPQMVLMDLGLPGMNGYEVARELRTRISSPLRLIAISGYGQPQDREQSKAAGFDAHLVKPVDWLALQALLANFAPEFTNAPAS